MSSEVPSMAGGKISPGASAPVLVIGAAGAAWMAAVAVYAFSVFADAADIPAYAYVLTALAALLPALACLALALILSRFEQTQVQYAAAHLSLAGERRIRAEDASLFFDVIAGAEEKIQTLSASVASLVEKCNEVSTIRREPAPFAVTAAQHLSRESSIEHTENESEAAVLQHERHLYDGLHALSIELVRLIDSAPSPDLWRRYMRGDRDAFTADFLERFADSHLTSEAYREKDDFRRTVVRYIAQYETLRERLARCDDSHLCDFLENASAGRLYSVLVQATADYAGAVA